MGSSRRSRWTTCVGFGSNAAQKMVKCLSVNRDFFLTKANALVSLLAALRTQISDLTVIKEQQRKVLLTEEEEVSGKMELRLEKQALGLSRGSQKY